MFSHGLAPLLTLPRSGPWGGVRGAVIHRLHENRTLHPTPASPQSEQGVVEGVTRCVP